MTKHECIGILLVEDHSSFRQALALTLAQEPGMCVVGQAGTLAAARELLAKGKRIDVGVFDLDLPDGNGAELIRALHAASPGSHVLVLTASAGRGDLARAVAAGAAGLLHKSVPLEEIVASVRRLAAGECLISTAELATMLRRAHEDQAERRRTQAILERLTPRERDVLLLLGEGLADKEIAARLHVGKDTVHTHMVNLLNKLGVESRLQALIVAIRHGLVSIDGVSPS